MKSLFSLWTQIFKVIVVTALLSTRASNGAAKQEPAFQEKVDTLEVISVVGGRASLPCDLTPPFPSDEPHLILFYKDVYGTPIYSFDMRQKEKGRHWKDNRTLGNRAFFHYKETGMRSETGAMQIASSLTIDALIPEDTGFYRCRVDFKEAPTKNTKIHLKLIVPPSTPIIRSEHGKLLDKVSEPVQEGSTLTLICETQGGEPLPRLTWKRGQSVLDDVVEEVDTQNRVVRNYLKMPSLHRKDHDDVLSCVASNTNLTARPQITYININMVFPPIRAKIVREWTFFNAGQAYNVSCQVLGSRPPAITAIYVGPSQLREVNYHVSPDGNVSTTTVIFIPDESDQGKFLSCRAENVQLSSSAVEDQWKLEVHYLPSVSLKMSSTLDGDLIRKGDTVYLQCEVKANPSVHTIHWTFEGKKIEPEKNTNLFATEDTLIFRGVHEANNGAYQCLAANQVGQGTSNTQTVNVKAFPSCANADLHTVVEVERHKATQLNCQYHSSSVGAAPLEFRWSMNSSNDYVDIPKSQFTTNGDRSVLTFSAKTEMDFGTLTCHATDAVGKAAPPCTFQIIPKGELSALRNCSTVNKTFDSLSIVCMNGSRTKNPNQRYILKVFNSQNHEMVVNISTNQPVFQVRGLSSGTEYRVRIYSVNDNGGVSEQTAIDTYTLQPAEKQLAATTTDLATNNPMRLLPIVAVLIAIVLLLVILAVIFVIIIRGRNGCANTAASSSTSGNQPASLAVPATASSLSYQKTHSSHSLRQPLTAASEVSGVGETTSIDDYHHHHIHAGHGDQQPQRHSSLGGRGSSQRDSASPASAYQYRNNQQKPSSTVLASELNSPDLILPAAAQAAAAQAALVAQAQAAQQAAAASKGGGYSINSLPGRGGHGHQPYDEILISGSGPPHHSNTIDRTGGTSSRNSTTEGKGG